jgi:hypothetical protein
MYRTKLLLRMDGTILLLLQMYGKNLLVQMYRTNLLLQMYRTNPLLKCTLQFYWPNTLYKYFSKNV